MPSFAEYQAEYAGICSGNNNGPLLQQQQQQQQQAGHAAFQPLGALLHGANQLLPGKQQLQQLREELEGPKPLRVVVGLAGLTLSAAAALGLLNIFRLLASPAQSVLECYEMIFGLMIAVVEIKAFFPEDSTIRTTCTKWFPFLTVLGGKGIFNIFVGSLGIGFGLSNLLVFVPAAAVLALGVVYVLFHLGRCNQLREKYDQTIYIYTPNSQQQKVPQVGDHPGDILFTA